MPRSAPVEGHAFEALGTSCSLFAVGLARSRLLEGEFWVRRIGARLTRFSPGSELSRFNASPGQWIEISAELEPVTVCAHCGDPVATPGTHAIRLGAVH